MDYKKTYLKVTREVFNELIQEMDYDDPSFDDIMDEEIAERLAAMEQDTQAMWSVYAPPENEVPRE